MVLKMAAEPNGGGFSIRLNWGQAIGLGLFILAIAPTLLYTGSVLERFKSVAAQFEQHQTSEGHATTIRRVDDNARELRNIGQRQAEMLAELRALRDEMRSLKAALNGK